jgi:hypothetical protein
MFADICDAPLMMNAVRQSSAGAKGSQKVHVVVADQPAMQASLTSQT